MARRVLTLAAAALTTVVAAAPAHAALVEARSPACGLLDCGPPDLFVQAAPGERNDVTVATGPDGLRIRDAGAPLQAGSPCTQVTAHDVACPPFAAVVVLAGDGDDVVTVPGEGEQPSVLADGGPGDDLLAGGPASDSLSGGPGSDRLAGGPGDDTLFDAEHDPQVTPDLLDGGAGGDRVDYGDRTRGVGIDLATGHAAEDEVTGVEHATGGAGDDRVLGDGGPNDLAGGAGADLLGGRDGEDELDLGFGPHDVALGGADDDVFLSPAPGTVVRCGDGVDEVEAEDLPIHVPDDCERAGADRVILALDLPLASTAEPFARTRRWRTCAGCPRTDGIKARVAAGRHRGRLVARPGFAVQLNAFGRRLLRAHGRLVVDLRLASAWVRVTLHTPDR